MRKFTKDLVLLMHALQWLKHIHVSSIMQHQALLVSIKDAILYCISGIHLLFLSHSILKLG